ncbi:MAG TPA: c-type cytochrome [Terriglobales bacterium]|nr:c-type cytochrome [Terriglobales bacterium]
MAVLLTLLAGCNSNSRRFDTAPAGGAPPMGTAVGPIPGTVPGRPMPLNPYSGDKIAIREGRRLFLWYNCAGCHGGHAGGGMGPSLRDPVWLYGDADAQIFDSIASGRGKGMPEWGTRVPQQQIWKLVAYIKSLRTPEEADPPIVPEMVKVPNPVITPAPKATQ